MGSGGWFLRSPCRLSILVMEGSSCEEMGGDRFLKLPLHFLGLLTSDSSTPSNHNEEEVKGPFEVTPVRVTPLFPKSHGPSTG